LKDLPGFNSGILNEYAQATSSIIPTEQIQSITSSSFLQAALVTSTLRLYLRTLAHKILFDSSKKAAGDLVETNGAQYILSANKEVIVSAGAVSLVFIRTLWKQGGDFAHMNHSCILLSYSNSLELVRQQSSKSLIFL
jgi:hypothetical protein